MRYDIAIVGSGPAGLCGAINAQIRHKNFIIFGNDNLSNKLTKAHKIDNYLGLNDISGVELAQKFKNHIDSLGISITKERINNIYAMGDYFTLMSNDNTYESSTVIIATGVEYSKQINGENEYLGKGVSYCATCDGSLYKGKKVAVIGYNDESISEANFLSEIASTTYYIPMKKNVEGLNKDIQVIYDEPSCIKGNKTAYKNL